jgi:hypothetical protein
MINTMACYQTLNENPLDAFLAFAAAVKAQSQPKIGTTKEYLPLGPGSPGVSHYIFVGVDAIGDLLKAFESGPCADEVPFWERREAKLGWVRYNNNGDDYWHGCGMGWLEGKKHTMTREEFMEWWANHQLMLSIDYWTTTSCLICDIIKHATQE